MIKPPPRRFFLWTNSGMAVSEVSLKEHFDRMLTEQDRRIEQAHRAAQEAVAKAESAIDKRLDLLNEFRGQAEDSSKKYALKEKVEELEARINKAHGAILLLFLLGVANLVKLFFG